MATLFAESGTVKEAHGTGTVKEAHGTGTVKEAHGNSLAGLTMPAPSITVGATGGARGIVEPVSVRALLSEMGKLSGGNVTAANNIVGFRRKQLEEVCSQLPSALQPPVA